MKKLKCVMNKCIIYFFSSGFILLCITLFMSYIHSNAATRAYVYNYGLHDDSGIDRYSWMSMVKYYYEDNQKNIPIKVKNNNYFDYLDLKNGFFDAKYLNIQTHGNIASFGSNDYGLVCIDKNKNKTYYTYSFVQLCCSSNSFSNLKVCYLGSCYSALSGRNMANAIYNHGAKCTIGYKDTVSSKHNSMMIKMFNLYFSQGKISVAQAMRYAQQQVYSKYGNYGNTNLYVIYGDKSRIFN